MIIADLLDTGGEKVGRVYLAEAPFPGDVVVTDGTELLVVRRTFLDLGPDTGPNAPVVSVQLKVRLV